MGSYLYITPFDTASFTPYIGIVFVGVNDNGIIREDACMPSWISQMIFFTKQNNSCWIELHALVLVKLQKHWFWRVIILQCHTSLSLWVSINYLCAFSLISMTILPHHIPAGDPIKIKKKVLHELTLWSAMLSAQFVYV